MVMLCSAIIPGSALDKLEDQEFVRQLRKPVCTAEHAYMRMLRRSLGHGLHVVRTWARRVGVPHRRFVTLHYQAKRFTRTLARAEHRRAAHYAVHLRPDGRHGHQRAVRRAGADDEGDPGPRRAVSAIRFLVVCYAETLDRLIALAQHAREVSFVPLVERPYLEDWVHPDGRFIALGEAAHPIPVRSPSFVLNFPFSHLSSVHRSGQYTRLA